MNIFALKNFFFVSFCWICNISLLLFRFAFITSVCTKCSDLRQQVMFCNVVIFKWQKQKNIFWSRYQCFRICSSIFTFLVEAERFTWSIPDFPSCSAGSGPAALSPVPPGRGRPSAGGMTCLLAEEETENRFYLNYRYVVNIFFNCVEA